MGLLDDAIREHLELKRQRGADPFEIDRLKHEALGPVRRQPLESANQASVRVDVDHRSVESERPSELSDAGHEERYEEDHDDEADTADWGEPFAEDVEPPGPRVVTNEPSPATSDRASTAPPSSPEHGAERGLRRWMRSRRRSGPPEDTPPTKAEPPEPASRRDEAVEYDIEDALAARGGRPGEHPTADQPSQRENADVLEETPEFLHEAPEHDRQWFEQRPPRDFDFGD